MRHVCDDPFFHLTAATGPYRRQLTESEILSHCNFALMDRTWKEQVGSLMADVKPILNAQITSLHAQVLAAAQADELDDLNRMQLASEDLVRTIDEHMARVANQAGRLQQREAEAQGVKVPKWELSGIEPDDDVLTASAGLNLIRQVARVTANILNGSLIQSAVRRALSLIGRPSITPMAIADDVSEHLRDLSDRSVQDSIGGAVTAAQNEGRRTVLAAAPAASYYESTEILDRNVCGPCRSEDGSRYGSLEVATKEYPSGGYRNCLGGVRCRGTIIAVWDKEDG